MLVRRDRPAARPAAPAALDARARRLCVLRDEIRDDLVRMARRRRRAARRRVREVRAAAPSGEDADEKKPTIKSWEHVAELTTKDFGQAKKLMIPFIPKGEWVSDRFCRGGRSTYEGTPQCKWHRLHTKDYTHFVRLIHYKNKMILQKAVLLGAEEEQEEEEEEEQEEEEEKKKEEVVVAAEKVVPAGGGEARETAGLAERTRQPWTELA